MAASTVAPEAYPFPSIFKIPWGHEFNLSHGLPFDVNTGEAEVVINMAPLNGQGKKIQNYWESKQHKHFSKERLFSAGSW